MSNYNRIVKVLNRIVAKLQKLEAKHQTKIAQRLEAIDIHKSEISTLKYEATRAANTAKNIAAILG